MMGDFDPLSAESQLHNPTFAESHFILSVIQKMTYNLSLFLQLQLPVHTFLSGGRVFYTLYRNWLHSPVLYLVLLQ